MGSIDKSQSCIGSPRQAIPARLVIGITGHRDLVETENIVQGIRFALKEIRQMIEPCLHGTPLLVTILSPLAEGADRLATREILKIPEESLLEVILPFEKVEYMNDLDTEESKSEFEELLLQANTIIVVPHVGSRDESYYHVGCHIVNQCDVLMALWDGKDAVGLGGTGNIVKYARGSNCPLVWIHTEDAGQVTVEPGRGLNIKPFQDLCNYNLEQLDAVQFERQLVKQSEDLESEARSAGLSCEKLKPTFDYFLHHYVRTDNLSLRYQQLHLGSETVVAALAFLAIAIVAFQFLFFSEQHWILIFEIAFMLIVLAIYSICRRRQWHTRWMDYRFLAERLRSAIFLSISASNLQHLRPPRHLSLAYSSNDWLVDAFYSVWNMRPPLNHPDDTIFEQLRNFTVKVWIQDQIEYHNSTNKINRKRYNRLAYASYILFGLTICAGSIHVIMHVVNIDAEFFYQTLLFMAIILPAAGATLSTIRIHRDHLRNSMRSGEMKRHLDELEDKMINSTDLKSFLALVRETEETMLHECEDWRVVVRFHAPEMPV